MGGKNRLTFFLINFFNNKYFNSAKQLIKGEPNVSYICSRYYRAPELIFGAIDYTCYIGKTNLFMKINY